MPSVLTNFTRVSVARDFVNSLNYTPHYIGIGGVLSWDNDLAPPTPTNTISNITDVWRDSYAMKRVRTVDASLAIPRITWTTGTVYDQYSDKLDLNNLSFYVITDTNDVFKCVDNNNGGISTIKPTVTNTSDLLPADGYHWKWMYNIPTQAMNKFGTADFIPVIDTSNNVAVPGEICRIDMIDVGSSYSYANIKIEGDGAGAIAYPTSTAGGHIPSITMANNGSGYNYAKITISGDGIDATAEAVLSPPGGHGSSPADELLAYYVILSTELDYDVDGFFLTNNEYRKIFIVREPLKFADNVNYVEAAANTTTRVQVTSATTFIQDQVVQIWLNSVNVGTATVAYIDSLNNTLHLCNITSSTITPTHKIYDGFNQISINGVTNSDVKIYSGKVLYVLNNTPIFRNITQSETIKIPILW